MLIYFFLNSSQFRCPQLFYTLAQEMFRVLLVSTVCMITINLAVPQYKTRSFKCKVSNKTVSSNFKCYAKSYNRHLTTINIDIIFKRPIYKAKVNLFISLKSFLTVFVAGSFRHATPNNYALLQFHNK